MPGNVIDDIVIKVNFDTASAEKDMASFEKKMQGLGKSGAVSGKSAKSPFKSAARNARAATAVFRTASRSMGSWFKKSNDYVESLNLFNVAMGDSALSARRYANEVERLMGIDVSEWLSYQGAFNQLAEGYGIASESANLMSQNLTQLAYDLSSLWNVDVKTAFQRLQSGMSGQIKGLKSWGINVSVAQLKETALAHGIELSTAKMTEAQKATLRYVTIMEQTANAQGDLARTIATPANALRILQAQWVQCQRAMGQVVSIIAVKVIPWFQALIAIIKEAAQSLAAMMGYELPEIDYSSGPIGGMGAFDDMADSIGNASEKAKELKRTVLGIDELNIMNDTSQSASSPVTGGGYDPTFGIDLSKYSYDFLKDVKMPDLEPMKRKLKEILGIAKDIGIVFLGWKLSKSFLGSLNGLVASIGITLLIDSIEGVLKDGIDIGDIVKGVIGGALAGAAIGFKFGGAGGAIGGAVIGIGVSLLITGITSIVSEGANTENITSTILGTLSSAAGIYSVVKIFNKKIKNPVPEFETASESIETVSTGTSSLTGKLTSLAKNLGLGVVIIAEVAASVILVTGAVWVLGKELEQVGIAWKPVIDNGALVATAMGIGAAALVGVGAVTALLGSVGTPLIANMALGTAMLALLGADAGLFIAEVLLIGKGLDKIGEAWQPVINNGENIKTGILTGTGLLIGIGVVTAALGAASVASVGLLPLAIGLGTALLAELSGALVLFIGSLVKTADQLNDELHPSLSRLNKNLPGLSAEMNNFTSFMTFFAEQVVDYTKSSAISGFASTVDEIVDFFTKDPIKSLSKDVNKQYAQTFGLNDNLRLANPELKVAIALMGQYYTFLEEIERLTGKTNNISLANGMFVNMKEVGKNLVMGFVSGIGSENSSLSRAVKSVLGDTFSDKVAASYGKSFGKNLGAGIVNGFKGTTFPTLKGTVNVKTSGDVSLKLKAYASGGFPEMGQMFIAREAGAELVGNIGNRTAVMNNDQIVSSVSRGVADANDEQNVILRMIIALLKEIRDKPSSNGGGYYGVSDVIRDIERKNRRDGKTAVPLGV